MILPLDEVTGTLRRTPGVLDALLGGAPVERVTANEGPQTWSPFDVVGHLIHGEETDWIPRARIILAHGRARPFDRFDRFAQFAKSKNSTLDELLDAFAAARRRSLDALVELRITPAMLEAEGEHPDLGRVTLGQLLSTWAVHDLSHIAQICRVMCRSTGDAVGPWRAYLPILGS